jgi:hypothetical protein
MLTSHEVPSDATRYRQRAAERLDAIDETATQIFTSVAREYWRRS